MQFWTLCDIIEKNKKGVANLNQLKSRMETKKMEKKNLKKKLNSKKKIFFLLLIAIIVIAIKLAISIHNWQTMALEMLTNQPSQVLDSEGEVIAEIGKERKRKNIMLSEMPEHLKNAYVAIEDERFYKHFGVDIKRTATAIGSYVIHFGKASFGASTITQQVVKNLTGDDANSPTRKVKEWTKAIALEWCMEKDEILGNYLNIIYVGPNIYGVESGAQYYFSKSALDLSLTECAFLAGINHAPNAYNPFHEEKDNTEKIQKRTKTVLNKMLELKKITEEEYQMAIAEVEEGITFQKGKLETEGDGIYSYHTDALLTEVISDLSEKKKISKTFATNYLYMANLHIDSTQNTVIQKELEKEFLEKQYALKSSNGEQTAQAAMVIIDHKTGQVLGCVGRLGGKERGKRI